MSNVVETRPSSRSWRVQPLENESNSTDKCSVLLQFSCQNSTGTHILEFQRSCPQQIKGHDYGTPDYFDALEKDISPSREHRIACLAHSLSLCQICVERSSQQVLFMKRSMLQGDTPLMKYISIATCHSARCCDTANRLAADACNKLSKLVFQFERSLWPEVVLPIRANMKSSLRSSGVEVETKSRASDQESNDEQHAKIRNQPVQRRHALAYSPGLPSESSTTSYHEAHSDSFSEQSDCTSSASGEEAGSKALHGHHNTKLKPHGSVRDRPTLSEMLASDQSKVQEADRTRLNRSYKLPERTSWRLEAPIDQQSRSRHHGQSLDQRPSRHQRFREEKDDRDQSSVSSPLSKKNSHRTKESVRISTVLQGTPPSSLDIPSLRNGNTSIEQLKSDTQAINVIKNLPEEQSFQSQTSRALKHSSAEYKTAPTTRDQSHEELTRPFISNRSPQSQTSTTPRPRGTQRLSPPISSQIRSNIDDRSNPTSDRQSRFVEAETESGITSTTEENPPERRSSVVVRPQKPKRSSILGLISTPDRKPGDSISTTTKLNSSTLVSSPTVPTPRTAGLSDRTPKKIKKRGPHEPTGKASNGKSIDLLEALQMLSPSAYQDLDSSFIDYNDTAKGERNETRDSPTPREIIDKKEKRKGRAKSADALADHPTPLSIPKTTTISHYSSYGTPTRVGDSHRRSLREREGVHDFRSIVARDFGGVQNVDAGGEGATRRRVRRRSVDCLGQMCGPKDDNGSDVMWGDFQGHA